MAYVSRRSPTLSDMARSGAVWAAASLLQKTAGARPRQAQARPVERVQHEAPARTGSADAPQDLSTKSWAHAIRRTITSFSDNRLLAVAAGVTFYVLLALFPALGAFVSLYGLVADPSTITEHIHALAGLLPGGAVDVITEQVSRIASSGSGTLGLSFAVTLLISLWSANSGVKALFDALNVAYEQEERRGFFKLNAISLAFTLGGMLLGLIALSAITVVPIVLNTIGLGEIVQWVLWIARWPVLLLILVFALAVIYRFGPSHNNARWRWLTPGSAIAAIVWLIFSMLFSWYVSNFGSYNKTYGTLGAVVGFMTWMWLSTAIVLIGGAINAELEAQAEGTKGAAPARRGESAPGPEPRSA